MSSSTSDSPNPSDSQAAPAASGKRKRPTSLTTTLSSPHDISADSVSPLGDRTPLGLFTARRKQVKTTAARHDDLVSRWPKVKTGSMGYDHSSVPKLPILDVEMPSWLTERVILCDRG
jgi:hypothetical protein